MWFLNIQLINTSAAKSIEAFFFTLKFILRNDATVLFLFKTVYLFLVKHGEKEEMLT